MIILKRMSIAALFLTASINTLANSDKAEIYRGNLEWVGASPNSNTLIVKTKDDISSICQLKNQIKWDANTPASNAILAVALSAYVTGKKVQVQYYPNRPCLGSGVQGGYIHFLN